VKLRERVEQCEPMAIGIFQSFGFNGEYFDYTIANVTGMHWYAKHGMLEYQSRVFWSQCPVGEALDSYEFCEARICQGPFRVDGLTAYAVDSGDRHYFMVFDDAKLCELTDEQKSNL
jgi:hypothetical protein